jgi:hypothetical protein
LALGNHPTPGLALSPREPQRDGNSGPHPPHLERVLVVAGMGGQARVESGHQGGDGGVGATEAGAAPAQEKETDGHVQRHVVAVGDLGRGRGGVRMRTSPGKEMVKRALARPSPHLPLGPPST